MASSSISLFTPKNLSPTQWQLHQEIIDAHNASTINTWRYGNMTHATNTPAWCWKQAEEYWDSTNKKDKKLGLEWFCKAVQLTIGSTEPPGLCAMAQSVATYYNSKAHLEDVMPLFTQLLIRVAKIQYEKNAKHLMLPALLAECIYASLYRIYVLPYITTPQFDHVRSMLVRLYSQSTGKPDSFRMAHYLIAQERTEYKACQDFLLGDRWLYTKPRTIETLTTAIESYEAAMAELKEAREASEFERLTYKELFRCVLTLPYSAAVTTLITRCAALLGSAGITEWHEFASSLQRTYADVVRESKAGLADSSSTESKATMTTTTAAVPSSLKANETELEDLRALYIKAVLTANPTPWLDEPLLSIASAADPDLLCDPRLGMLSGVSELIRQPLDKHFLWTTDIRQREWMKQMMSMMGTKRGFETPNNVNRVYSLTRTYLTIARHTQWFARGQGSTVLHGIAPLQTSARTSDPLATFFLARLMARAHRDGEALILYGLLLMETLESPVLSTKTMQTIRTEAREKIDEIALQPLPPETDKSDAANQLRAQILIARWLISQQVGGKFENLPVRDSNQVADTDGYIVVKGLPQPFNNTITFDEYKSALNDPKIKVALCAKHSTHPTAPFRQLKEGGYLTQEDRIAGHTTPMRVVNFLLSMRFQPFSEKSGFHEFSKDYGDMCTAARGYLSAALGFNDKDEKDRQALDTLTDINCEWFKERVEWAVIRNETPSVAAESKATTERSTPLSGRYVIRDKPPAKKVSTLSVSASTDSSIVPITIFTPTMATTTTSTAAPTNGMG